MDVVVAIEAPPPQGRLNRRIGTAFYPALRRNARKISARAQPLLYGQFMHGCQQLLRVGMHRTMEDLVDQSGFYKHLRVERRRNIGERKWEQVSDVTAGR
jgi:hypothetical protein